MTIYFSTNLDALMFSGDIFISLTELNIDFPSVRNKIIEATPCQNSSADAIVQAARDWFSLAIPLSPLNPMSLPLIYPGESIIVMSTEGLPQLEQPSYQTYTNAQIRQAKYKFAEFKSFSRDSILNVSSGSPAWATGFL